MNCLSSVDSVVTLPPPPPSSDSNLNKAQRWLPGSTLERMYSKTGTQARQTTGKRRPRGDTNRGAAHRNYASENDIPSDTALAHDFGADHPYTPKKMASGSPAPNPAPSNAKTARRSGHKGRPKNVSTSPRPLDAGRNTPPHAAVSKPTSATAFAGATFHASPAPSSLPIPTFFSKPVPESPGTKMPASDNRSSGASPTVSDSEAPATCSQKSPAPQEPREESPLDIFFRADRAEKEKARRASSAKLPMFVSGSFSPPLKPHSPAGSFSFPRGQDPPATKRLPAQRNSGFGISGTELDGTPGKPIGPAFSTPYQERIRAARFTEKQAQPPRQVVPQSQAPTSPTSLDKSDALKKFLWGAQETTAFDTADATPQHVHSSVNQQSTPHTSQPRSAPSEPAARTSGSDRPADLLAMEDNLRRILNLTSV